MSIDMFPDSAVQHLVQHQNCPTTPDHDPENCEVSR